MYGILKSFGIPDVRREIKGISGDSYSYSYLIYGLFILLNLIILFSAVVVLFKLMLNNFGRGNQSSASRMLLFFNALFYLGANELSKTFFWTPHSQIFNILIPVIALWVIDSPRFLQRPFYFYLFSSFMGVLMFAYPAFGLILILLCFTGFLSWRSRVMAVVLSAIPYLMYPYILRFLGYQYENKAIVKFREFIWVIDGMTGKSSMTIYFEKFWSFLGSLPLIPSTLIILCFMYILWHNPHFFRLRENQLFIGFFAIYICYVLGIGLGERRISFALILFSGLYLFMYSAKSKKRLQSKYFTFLLLPLALVQIGSWVFTTGPLV
jgi:hypothetical protein